ncbi:hypothetical protein RUND412_006621 [Rhizina undulata]
MRVSNSKMPFRTTSREPRLHWGAVEPIGMNLDNKRVKDYVPDEEESLSVDVESDGASVVIGSDNENENECFSITLRSECEYFDLMPHVSVVFKGKISSFSPPCVMALS